LLVLETIEVCRTSFFSSICMYISQIFDDIIRESHKQRNFQTNISKSIISLIPLLPQMSNRIQASISHQIISVSASNTPAMPSKIIFLAKL
jgi:hypothetical protein